MRFQWFIVLFLCIPLVTAIGVSPASLQFDYAPGQQQSTSVRVINYNAFPIGIEVRSTGVIADSVASDDTIILPAGGAAMVPISFTMPVGLRPGRNVNYIFFKERYTSTTQGTFAPRTEVGLTVVLWQPYPGHYAEIAASAESVPQGEDTLMRIYINNLGVEPLVGATATVDVVGPDGVRVDTYTIDNIDLAGNSNTMYSQPLASSQYKPGRYVLASRLVYGDNTTSMNGSFIVGVADVEVLSLTGPLYLDKPVNRYTVEVQSLWNLPFDGVYATVALGQSQSQTPSVSLQGFGTTQLNGYWETDASLIPGMNQATVTAYFPDGKKTAILPIMVYNETPRVEAPTLEEPTVVISGADILFLCIVIAIVLYVIIFAYRRIRRRDPPPEVPPPQ
jgi:hypothetical protein